MDWVKIREMGYFHVLDSYWYMEGLSSYWVRNHLLLSINPLESLRGLLAGKISDVHEVIIEDGVHFQGSVVILQV